MTIAHIRTVSFQGIDTLEIDFQVHMANSLPNTNAIGLPDKASARARSGSATDLCYLSTADALKKAARR